MNKHEFIGGMPRSGKTHYGLNKIKTEDTKALIIDIKAEIKIGKLLTDVNSPKELMHAIKNYKIVTFWPTNDLEIATKQIDYICDKLLELRKEMKIKVLIDEIEDFIPQGTQNSSIYKIARRGLVNENKGIRLLLIGQSPSNIDKRALQKIEKITMFRMNDWGYKYLKSKGLPADEIQKMLVESKKYSRVELDNGKINLFAPVKI